MTSPIPETTPGANDRIITPEDEDWDWRAGHKLIQEAAERCRLLSGMLHRSDATDRAPVLRSLDGTYDVYYFKFQIEEFEIYIGDDDRVKVYAREVGGTYGVFATHAQGTTDWRLIQTRLLPLLRARMVLDDLAAQLGQ